METQYKRMTEAEASGGYTPTAVPCVVSVPAGRSAPGVAPPAYFETPGPRWSWCSLVTAVISLFFCTCCGVVATVMAMASYTDHKARDFARSQKKRKWAYGLAITAIMIGSICVIACIIMSIIALRMELSFEGRDRYPDTGRQPDRDYYTEIYY